MEKKISEKIVELLEKNPDKKWFARDIVKEIKEPYDLVMKQLKKLKKTGELHYKIVPRIKAMKLGLTQIKRSVGIYWYNTEYWG